MGRLWALSLFYWWLLSHATDAYVPEWKPRASLLIRSLIGAEGYDDAPLDELEEAALSKQPRKVTIEERVLASVASTAASTLGGTFGRSYTASREALKISKDRAMARMERSAYAKEKAEQKIAAIRSKMEKEIENVEMNLRAKIDEAQLKLDEDVARICSLLQEAIFSERAREVRIRELVEMLKFAIADKVAEISREEGIFAQMTEVRSSHRPGKIATQLDALLDQKRSLLDIENQLLVDMSECLTEMISVLDDCRVRSSKFDEVLNRITRQKPIAAQAGEMTYQWLDIEEMENVLHRAATTATLSDKKIRGLQKHMDENMVMKKVLTGEDVLESIEKGGESDFFERTITTKTKAALQPLMYEITGNKMKYDELRDMDDSEVLGVLAKSLGHAALSSSKAAVFGIKAVIDNVSKQSTADAAGEHGGRSNVASERDTSTVAGIVDSEASKKSGDALKDASKNILSAAGAIAALGAKNMQRIRDRVDEAKAKDKKNDSSA